MANSENHRRRYWEPVLIGISAAIGLIAGYNMDFSHGDYSLLSKDVAKSIDAPTSTVHGDGRVEEIIRFIENKYVDSIETEKITINMIDNMLSELDPHSSYITPDELDGHNERMQGEYRGIGIESIKLQDTFYISKIQEGGPAAKAGLEVGHAFISVEGDEVAGQDLSFEEIRKHLKAENKRKVDLELMKLDGQVYGVSVDISEIEVPSASICYLLDKETAYLKLSRFSANTYEQFIESIEKLKDNRQSLNLVLDLRENPGGFLPQAIKILSQLFQEKDQLLTYTEGLNQKKKEFRSTGNAFYNIDKVAVLIDEYSASGSEILSGAIQDWDRGVVIGQTSYGKGLVQEIYPLKNGGALRLTVAKYYTPSGRLIQKSYSSDNNNFNADTNVYQTKVLSRKMSSGNGINPDQPLPSTIGFACYDYWYYIDFYLLHKMKVNQGADIERRQLTTEDYNMFVAEYFDQESFIPDNAACQKNLEREIWNSYQRMQLNDLAYLQFLNENDAYVEKALQFIRDQRPTLAYLSEEK